MSLLEFRRTSFAMIGEMLDEFTDLTQNLFHWPIARLASIQLEMNRNDKERPEPYSEFDVMPHLGKAPPPDPSAKDRQMFARFQKYFPGLEEGS